MALRSLKFSRPMGVHSNVKEGADYDYGGKQRTTTMTQSETRVPEHLSDIAGQNIETLAAIQKQLLDVLTKANHEWVTFLNENEEAELASNLSKKMTTANSIPDVTAAYQELISRQMELMTRRENNL